MPSLIANKDEPDWARTSDPLIKSQLLYQLSYRPAKGKQIIRAISIVSSEHECVLRLFNDKARALA
jgi:hypothetical protein